MVPLILANIPSRKQPKRSCGKSQTFCSRSGPDNVSETVGLASADEVDVDVWTIASAEEGEADGGPIARVGGEEKKLVVGSITAVEAGKSDAGSIAAVEEDEEAKPFYIDDYMVNLDKLEDKLGNLLTSFIWSLHTKTFQSSIPFFENGNSSL